MDNLTKCAIAALVFYFLFMRKEGFALAEGVLTDKTQLDPTFFYKKGILNPQTRNTITEAINNGQTCAAEFPQEIYVPIPKVPAQCKLPEDIQRLYQPVVENSQTCPGGMKTLIKIDVKDRVKFNNLTTLSQPQNYVDPNEAMNQDCFSQLYNNVPQTQQFACGSVDAQCMFNTADALREGNMESNYNINENDIRSASQW
jgi:hypothetical protein